MKHIHFMPDSRYAKDFIVFVNSNFNMKDHYFVIYKNDARYVQKEKNVLWVRDLWEQRSKFERKLLAANKVYFHYMTDNCEKLILRYCLFTKQILTWRIWESDLYKLLPIKRYDEETVKIGYSNPTLQKNIWSYLRRIAFYRLDVVHVTKEYFNDLQSNFKIRACCNPVLVP